MFSLCNLAYMLESKVVKCCALRSTCSIPCLTQTVVSGGDNLNLSPGFLDNGLYAVRHFQFPSTLSTVVGDMGVARWYPTTISLQDGLIIIAGGSTAEGGGYGGSTAEGSGIASDSSLNEPTYQVFLVQLFCRYSRNDPGCLSSQRPCQGTTYLFHTNHLL